MALPNRPTSLARALGVLAIVVDRGEARADEIAEELALPVSTVYRYLRDLREAGFVVEQQSTYRPGSLISGQPSTRASRTDLRRLARPTLEQLARESGETALVAVRNGSHALCLDQVESHHSMRMAFRIGEVLPLYAGAVSRVLLAFAPPSIQEEVLAGISRVTDATPDAESLPWRLATIRATGLATSRSELVAGAIAIAAPVMQGDQCAFAIAIAAPDRRGTGEWQLAAKTLLTDARSNLEALL